MIFFILTSARHRGEYHYGFSQSHRFGTATFLYPFIYSDFPFKQQSHILQDISPIRDLKRLVHLAPRLDLEHFF